MSKILDKSVTKNDDNSWDFACPGVADSPCGQPGGQPFTSVGWPTKDVARARGQQHFDEHKGLYIAQPMEDFMADHGLTTAPDGACVKIEDLP